CQAADPHSFELGREGRSGSAGRYIRGGPTMTLPVSVIVLTFNEELNIARCLDSVSWCDDVVVVDSHSTDRTREIAAAKGARVELRPFDNYANQRNHALKEIEYRHPWVLMLDADEVV